MFEELVKVKLKCNLCRGSDFVEIVDLGLTPIAHRYKKTNNISTTPEYKHKLAIQVCRGCAFIQLIDPIPADELYREYNFCFSTWKPQPHMLDEIEILAKTLPKNSAIAEIGSNDGSFLKLLNEAGFQSLIGIEPNSVAAEISRKTGVAVLETYFDHTCAQELKNRFGQIDAIVSRQCVEHIPDLQSLMKNINHMLKLNGWVMFEVPDFEVPLIYGDCSQLWEEHVNYFTEPVMRAFLMSHGYRVELVKRYPFSGGALMVFAQRTQLTTGEMKVTNEIQRIKELALGFRSKVEKFKEKVISLLKSNHEKGLANVLYGSGCRANTVLNGLKLAEYIDVIVDDQPEKIGLLMPGCSIEIKSSDALYQHIGTCLLSVNTENEQRVMSRHKAYLEAGGCFYSLNSPSDIYLLGNC